MELEDAEPELGAAKPAHSNYRRKLPHLQTGSRPIFVTFVTYRRKVLPTIARSSVRDCIVRGHGLRFTLHAAVVMPDHVHVLMTPGVDEQGSVYGRAQIMSGMKGSAAHAVNKMLGRNGRLWQDESFDRALRSEESILQKADYICANPVRAGLVTCEDDYPFLWRESVEGAG